jgi:hypothetical protein
MKNELNKKQTAVDFIFSQLPDEYTTTRQGFEVYKQAKQMEKEQMCKFAYKCHNHYKVYGGFKIEEYFEEKYGKKTFIDLVSDEESKVHEVVRKLKEKRIK